MQQPRGLPYAAASRLPPTWGCASCAAPFRAHLRTFRCLFLCKMYVHVRSALTHGAEGLGLSLISEKKNVLHAPNFKCAKNNQVEHTRQPSTTTRKDRPAPLAWWRPAGTRLQASVPRQPPVRPRVEAVDGAGAPVGRGASQCPVFPNHEQHKVCSSSHEAVRDSEAHLGGGPPHLHCGAGGISGPGMTRWADSFDPQNAPNDILGPVGQTTVKMQNISGAKCGKENTWVPLGSVRTPPLVRRGMGGPPPSS